MATGAQSRLTAIHIGQSTYAGWAGWARERGLGVDFNATMFGHPKAESGFTLSSSDEAVRRFWVEHVRRCREVSAWFGRELGSPCIHNLWIPGRGQGCGHGPLGAQGPAQASRSTRCLRRRTLLPR